MCILYRSNNDNDLNVHFDDYKYDNSDDHHDHTADHNSRNDSGS